MSYNVKAKIINCHCVAVDISEFEGILDVAITFPKATVLINRACVFGGYLNTHNFVTHAVQTVMT